MKLSLSQQLAVITALVFVISAVFPIGAGLARDPSRLPHWWGAADVTIAFVLGALALAVMGLGQSRITKQVEDSTYRGYRILIHGILALLVIFLWFGEYVAWPRCLSGFAWRSWLLLYAMPAWIATYREQR